MLCFVSQGLVIADFGFSRFIDRVNPKPIVLKP